VRFYGKRFLRNTISDRMEQRTETRDAILWDVLPAQRLCRVKISGSTELVAAYYPENWEQTPFWLKPGNAVRITHTGGNRGKVEVVGHGQLVPAQAGFPTLATPSNAVITACEVTQVPNAPQMMVFVKTGVFRVAGVEYTLDAIAMSNTAIFLMGMGGHMGDVAGVVAVDAAPAAGNFRYDLIVVGADGVIDYVKGTNFQTSENMPSVPAGHVKLGIILIYGGMTVIYTYDINISWQIPTSTKLGITVADADLAWAELSTTVTVAVLDQYGNAVLTGGSGWYLKLKIVAGNGKVSSPEEGESVTEIGGHTGSGSNQYVFTYTRNQLPGDLSPTLQAVLEVDFEISAYTFIMLRDAAGDPMVEGG